MTSWPQAFSRDTLHPPRVKTALERIASIWPESSLPLPDTITALPEEGKLLLHLLSISPITAEKIYRDPDLLLWLGETPLPTPRSPSTLRRAYLEMRGEDERFDPQFSTLRHWKNRETTRIALREISGADIAQTSAEISDLAQFCLQQVYSGWNQKLREQLGSPDTEFCALGMGKLGGRELNFSSDIDLIFFYGEDGAINKRWSHQLFFQRLAEKIFQSFNQSHPQGSLFRLDLRLRPEGNSGPLVRPLEAMENYYASQGETWERMALIKARCIAGDLELGYEFLQHLQPFLYSRHLGREVLEEIGHLKDRIEKEIVGHRDLDNHVKLGRGGIREIEFIVQSLQVIHGARYPYLQEPSTIKALQALATINREDPLLSTDIGKLEAAYRWLRRLEHRIMIVAEKQTHRLPSERSDRELLARSLGFDTIDEFTDYHHHQTALVHQAFREHFRQESPTSDSTNKSGLELSEASQKLLHQLSEDQRHGLTSHRSRKIFRNLEPLLLEELARAVEPETVLIRLSRFVESYGIRATLFELLMQHPRLLELLRKLFDSSALLSEIAIQRPQLLEEITRSGDFGRDFTLEDYLSRSAPLAAEPEPTSALQRWQTGELLRIGLREILEIAPFEIVTGEYSDLALSCIQFYHSTCAPDLTVVALGKMGGRELIYGSDLDLLFIGSDISQGEQLLQKLNQRHSQGALYEVDLRLRPEGASGPLVTSWEAYQSYFQNRASFWEIQTLTKTRPLLGPDIDRVATFIHELWGDARHRFDIFAEIRTMRERIVAEKSTPSTDPLLNKVGRGGLMDLDFLVQGLQMRHAIWETNTWSAVNRLESSKILTSVQADQWRTCYHFLKRCELLLRRSENRSISKLPSEQSAQEKLAARMGYTNRDEFWETYRKLRLQAEMLFTEILKAPEEL